METVFPVEDPALMEKTNEILDALLADNVKARELKSDGMYSRVKAKGNQPKLNVQEHFLSLAKEQAQKIDTIS